MAEDKWWGKEESKKDTLDSKEEVEEMINHTEMMKIKREEEMEQAQHEFNMSKINQEMLGTKAGIPIPATINQGAMMNQTKKEGPFSWMTDDPGYLFLAIIVSLGLVGSIVASILTPDIDEIWGTANGTVLEDTEWWEWEIEEEDCLYDEYNDEYYDCIYYYTYDCGADVIYNYSILGTEYIGEEFDWFLGNWDDYCLEIVQNEILPLGDPVKVWYKLDDNGISQMEQPNDDGAIFSFFGLCCLLPILLSLLFFMYFEGNNDQYESLGSNGSNEVHHYHHGGGIMGGVYYGSPWYRRPWF
ncbi:hypothetical protein OAR96_02300, partial [Euryarchaeota archaeon]|nr:hypothetical protein [Euryarchaeota archaeon]